MQNTDTGGVVGVGPSPIPPAISDYAAVNAKSVIISENCAAIAIASERFSWKKAGRCRKAESPGLARADSAAKSLCRDCATRTSSMLIGPPSAG